MASKKASKSPGKSVDRSVKRSPRPASTASMGSVAAERTAARQRSIQKSIDANQDPSASKKASRKTAVQAGPQSMFAGADVTTPLPAPALLTVNVNAGPHRSTAQTSLAPHAVAGPRSRQASLSCSPQRCST